MLRRLDGPRNVALLAGLWFALISGAFVYLQSVLGSLYYATNGGQRFGTATILAVLPLVSVVALATLIVIWRKKRISFRRFAAYLTLFLWASGVTIFLAVILYLAPKVLLGR